jgi:hypothetical protein
MSSSSSLPGHKRALSQEEVDNRALKKRQTAFTHPFQPFAPATSDVPESYQFDGHGPGLLLQIMPNIPSKVSLPCCRSCNCTSSEKIKVAGNTRGWKHHVTEVSREKHGTCTPGCPGWIYLSHGKQIDFQIWVLLTSYFRR